MNRLFEYSTVCCVIMTSLEEHTDVDNTVAAPRRAAQSSLIIRHRPFPSRLASSRLASPRPPRLVSPHLAPSHSSSPLPVSSRLVSPRLARLTSSRSSRPVSSRSVSSRPVAPSPRLVSSRPPSPSSLPPSLSLPLPRFVPSSTYHSYPCRRCFTVSPNHPYKRKKNSSFPIVEGAFGGQGCLRAGRRVPRH